MSSCMPSFHSSLSQENHAIKKTLKKSLPIKEKKNEEEKNKRK